MVNGEYQAELNSTIPFQVTATDNVGVTGLQLFANNLEDDITTGNQIEIVNNQAIQLDRYGIGNITFDELGTYQLTAYGYDEAGNVGEYIITVEVFDGSDVTAPVVSLDLTGIENNTITAPTDIIGTIDDDNLNYYSLEIATADSDEFVEIFRGNSNKCSKYFFY